MEPQETTTVPIRVFVVSDHQVVLCGLEGIIRKASPGFSYAGCATSCSDAVGQIYGADVVLIDLDADSKKVLEAIPVFHAKFKAAITLITRSADSKLHDEAILAGARGILKHDTPPDLLLQAIAKVKTGQIWLDRDATGRIFVEMSRRALNGPTLSNKKTDGALTDRERKIISCIAKHVGEPAKKTAARLHISESTLRNHLTSIYSKLGVSNRHGLLAHALREALAD